MDLVLAALPGVITSCLLGFVLAKLLDRHADERQAHRDEVAAAARALLEQVQMHRIEVDSLTRQHAEQTQKLLEAHRREVANLCQRLQAPDVAVAEHVGQNTTFDPPSVDLADDQALIEIAARERNLKALSSELFQRAEELAAEA